MRTYHTHRHNLTGSSSLVLLVFPLLFAGHLLLFRLLRLLLGFTPLHRIPVPTRPRRQADYRDKKRRTEDDVERVEESLLDEAVDEAYKACDPNDIQLQVECLLLPHEVHAADSQHLPEVAQ